MGQSWSGRVEYESDVCHEILMAAKAGLTHEAFDYCKRLNALKGSYSKRDLEERLVRGAACTGRLDLLRHFVYLTCGSNVHQHQTRHALAAAYNDHRECLEFLIDSGFNAGSSETILSEAASGRSGTDCMRYVYERTRQHTRIFLPRVVRFSVTNYGNDDTRRRMFLFVDWRRGASENSDVFIRIQIHEGYDNYTTARILSALACKIRMRNAVRALELGFLRRRDLKRHRAAATIARAWIEWHFRPGGRGEEKAKEHYMGYKFRGVTPKNISSVSESKQMCVNT